MKPRWETVEVSRTFCACGTHRGVSCWYITTLEKEAETEAAALKSVSPCVCVREKKDGLNAESCCMVIKISLASAASAQG